MKKIILFIHQSAELYGSDKTLLYLVKNINQEKYHPIILLPVKGPLEEELINSRIEHYIVPISKLSRATLSLSGILKLPYTIVKSVYFINKKLSGRKVDIVHSNTLAILTGAIWSRLNKTPHVWHVHEIITSPKIVLKIYSILLKYFSDIIICNSYATKLNILSSEPRLANKSNVVWNGLDRTNNVNIKLANRYRKELGLLESDILIALVGRINRWKGQKVLVEAAEILKNSGLDNVYYIIVGSPPSGQEHFEKSLRSIINSSPVKEKIFLKPFLPEIWPVWDACNIAVIPSIDPEPFGMVALEAMISSKPIVASNHGGVTEIISNGETGLLAEPNNPNSLAEALQKLITDENYRIEMGEKGYSRYEELFTLNHYVGNIQRIYESL